MQFEWLIDPNFGLFAVIDESTALALEAVAPRTVQLPSLQGNCYVCTKTV
jgi:hypothetical protein